jgi:hypothetical protein
MRLEDLESQPLGELRRIYSGLGLSGFESVLPLFQKATEAARSYRKNTFVGDRQTETLLRDEWAFAFDAFGYN